MNLGTDQIHRSQPNILSGAKSSMAEEVLDRPPNWLIRWGTTLLLVILLLLFVGSSLVSYNDIIPAKIVITSKNPPIYLQSRTSGKLESILVDPGDLVISNQILAEIENSAKFEDVLILERLLSEFRENLSELDSIEIIFPTTLELGSMQKAYANFLSSLQTYKLNRQLLPNTRESEQIRKQKNDQRSYLKNQFEQLKLFEKKLELAKRKRERIQRLFERNVISELEFEEASMEYLSSLQQYENLQANISSAHISIADFDKLLIRTNIRNTEYENTYRQEVENSFQILTMTYNEWNRDFLIRSPINGRVTTFDFWKKYQEINAGESLFTVVPIELGGIIGKVSLPIRNSGKVKSGQRVVIKLENYPFSEWGSLDGRIVEISEIPKKTDDNYYSLFIEIKSLKTSFGKDIEFKQEMQGKADIVVEELSILDRIFYQLRKLVVHE